MPQSLSQVYVHIIFSTKYREYSIDDIIAPELHAYFGGICRELKCNAVKVGGFYDHIHILAKLHKSVTQMHLMEEIKKRSSKWIKTKGEHYQHFYWQDGYGIFSVNPTGVTRVTKYIENQKQHHTTASFKEEFISYLKKYNIDYDERYLWD